MKVFIIILNCFFLIACNYRDVKNNFDPRALENAWRDNNRKVVARWINSLEIKELPDSEFFSRVAYLSSTTNFCFGNLEVGDSSWQDKSEATKSVIRQNVALAYKNYLNSCLYFNKEITWDDTLPLQKRYYKSDMVMTEDEIKQLRQEIEKICTKT